MVDANNGRFVPVSAELAAKFADPESQLNPYEAKQRDWVRFEEGEIVALKGVTFRVHEVGETRLVLKLVKGQTAGVA